MSTTTRPDDGEKRSVENAHEAKTETLSLALHAEEIAVGRRTVSEGAVRVAAVTREREHLIDEPLTHERVEVERVAIGRAIDAVPPVREEGDMTIIPVVEEVIVVERRLVLKEEIHVRRVRVTEHYREIVTVREQDAVITRIPTQTERPQGQDLGEDQQVPPTDSTHPAQEQQR